MENHSPLVHDISTFDRSDFSEKLLQIFTGSVVGEIPHKDLGSFGILALRTTSFLHPTLAHLVRMDCGGGVGRVGDLSLQKIPEIDWLDMVSVYFFHSDKNISIPARGIQLGLDKRFQISVDNQWDQKREQVRQSVLPIVPMRKSSKTVIKIKPWSGKFFTT